MNGLVARSVSDEGPVRLDRQEGISLWRQIARRIEDDIVTGRHAPGSRLPTEAQLSQRFAVNRHTIRRAIEELSRSGLIRVEQGRGSFVNEDVLEYQVGARPRFSEWVRRHNKEPFGEVVDLREVPAEPGPASALGIRPGTRIVRFERLGLADNRPVGLSTHHFPATRYPGLADALREFPSITEALAHCGVADYRRQITRVSARMPTAQEAELLRMPRNRPVLTTESINVDQSGAIVEFGMARYPTPRVQLVFEP
jgi:GntR family phosphonate transport system transcriptional regulator